MLVIENNPTTLSVSDYYPRKLINQYLKTHALTGKRARLTSDRLPSDMPAIDHSPRTCSWAIGFSKHVAGTTLLEAHRLRGITSSRRHMGVAVVAATPKGPRLFVVCEWWCLRWAARACKWGYNAVITSPFFTCGFCSRPGGTGLA